MKRLLLRLTAVSMVLSMGGIAIIQALKGSDDSAGLEPTVPETAPAEASSIPQPIPASTSGDAIASSPSDPFTSSRFVKVAQTSGATETPSTQSRFSSARVGIGNSSAAEQSPITATPVPRQSQYGGGSPANSFANRYGDSSPTQVSVPPIADPIGLRDEPGKTGASVDQHASVAQQPTPAAVQELVDVSTRQNALRQSSAVAAAAELDATNAYQDPTQRYDDPTDTNTAATDSIGGESGQYNAQDAPRTAPAYAAGRTNRENDQPGVSIDTRQQFPAYGSSPAENGFGSPASTAIANSSNDSTGGPATYGGDPVSRYGGAGDSVVGVNQVEPAVGPLPTVASVGSGGQPLDRPSTGRPGDAELEGVQAPSLTLEKIAPDEIQIGRLATFQTTVRNSGKVTARQVLIRDEVPAGTRLVSTSPEATSTADGSLLWQLGTLEAGEEQTVSMELMPEEEGEIGSVATALFEASASVRTVATRPLLELQLTAAPKVHIHDTVTLNIRLSNPGSGAATGVIIEEDVPDGLSHPAGHALEFEVGTLQPGESRELELTLGAETAGIVENVLIARADANLVVEKSVELEVIAPSLKVSMSGPAKRYLERHAKYTFTVANPGTAPAKEIELVAYLPKGMQFVESNNAGKYDESTHAVYWSLEELPPSQMGSVELTTLPIEPGEHKIRIEGRADMDLTDAQEKTVLVEGLASIFFEVADISDPIEVGQETTYEVRLVNEGSQASTNLRVSAQLPQGMRPLSADGPTRGTVNGQVVIFQPLSRLDPKAETVYTIQVQGLTAGNQRIRVQVISDDMSDPVIEEEHTRVYADS